MRTIKSAKVFQAVFKRGRRVSRPLVRVSAMECSEEGGSGRVAFIAAKRLGCAPVRNRCKRVLRAAAQECGLPLRGQALLLFATPKTCDATSGEVAADLRKALQKAGLLS